MTTKVTIRTTGREVFQVFVAVLRTKHSENQLHIRSTLVPTVAELKAEISKSKGYTTETLKLIHSGKSFGSLLPSLLFTCFVSRQTAHRQSGIRNNGSQ